MPTFVTEQRDHEPIVLDLPVYNIDDDAWENVEFFCKQMLPPRTILGMQEAPDDELTIGTLVEFWTVILTTGSAARMTDILTGESEGIDLKVLTDAFGWAMEQLGAGDSDDPPSPPA